MTKTVRFNAFEMNCVAHQSPGLWRHPKDRSWQYKDVEYWTDLAKILEKGLFDAIFIADVIGYYDIYQGNNDAALRGAVQIPVNDPLQLANPIASVTRHLGIGITASTSFEHPYTFARRLSTADHHTKGRVGWNIVTSYLESGARNVSQAGLNQHDNRYEVAEEYVEVLYKLWEGSWEEGAVIRGRERGVFAIPEKIHEIGHKGKYFEVPGYHLSEPSPQRTPVLFQAGSSTAGRDFAARHAELAFIGTPLEGTIRPFVQDIRRRAEAAGREPGLPLVYGLATIVVDETDAKAQAKLKDYQKYASHEGGLVLTSGWTGIDFGTYAPTDSVRRVPTNAIISAVEHLAEGGKTWSIEELGQWASIGGMGPLFVGSASTVADELQRWLESTDLDGFNLAYVLAHQTFEDVVGHLVPELQRRGVYPRQYRDGTLREQLFGAGPYLPDSHPAARYRDIERVKRETAQRHGQAGHAFPAP